MFHCRSFFGLSGARLNILQHGGIVGRVRFVGGFVGSMLRGIGGVIGGVGGCFRGIGNFVTRKPAAFNSA